MEHMEVASQLIVKNGTLVVKKIDLAIGSYTVGKDSTDILLDYPTVSKLHGWLRVEPGKVFFQDNQSRNGSRLNKTLLRSDWFHPISESDTLEVGPFSLEVRNAPAKKETIKEQALIIEGAKQYESLLKNSPQQARELLYDFLQRNFSDLCDTQTITTANRKIIQEYHGNGPVAEFIENDFCKDLIINAHNEIYADMGFGLQKTGQSFLSENTYVAWATHLARQNQRRLDLQNPICDATLANGARFHAVLPPISEGTLSVSIRKMACSPINEQQAIETAWIEPQLLPFLKEAVRNKKNIVISGGTGSGKTSLLNFLCQYLNDAERVITIEDTVELKLPVSNIVRLQSRAGNADGAGEISLRKLIHSALRMRPDRIIVGECRGPEVFELIQALNTGHPGTMTTLHANSPLDALDRLELLALLEAHNLSIEILRKWLTRSIDIVIQVEREISGTRILKSVFERNKDSFVETYARRSH